MALAFMGFPRRGIRIVSPGKARGSNTSLWLHAGGVAQLQSIYASMGIDENNQLNN